jgi:hypothetical protein
MKLGLTAEQKIARRSCIGGSDAGAIVAGGEEWRKLWAIKTGRAVEDDLSNILAVQMGSFTEPFNLFWYEKQTGRVVARRGERVQHPRWDYMACNLDGATTTASGELASFQAKHVGKAGDQMVLRYTAQCTHEALCCGYDHYVLSAFIGNSKWELTEGEVDPFFASDYLSKCADFWMFVKSDREPPEVEPLPVPAPKKLRRVVLEANVEDPLDESGWPNWGSAMAEYLDVWKSTKAAADLHGVAHRSVKELMPEDVGTIIRYGVKAAKDKAGAVRISMGKGDER